MEKKEIKLYRIKILFRMKRETITLPNEKYGAYKIDRLDDFRPD